MKKYISIILQFDGNRLPLKTIEIESLRNLHELEIYEILLKLVPAYISVNFEDATDQNGYSYEYKNGLNSVAIYRTN